MSACLSQMYWLSKRFQTEIAKPPFSICHQLCFVFCSFAGQFSIFFRSWAHFSHFSHFSHFCHSILLTSMSSSSLLLFDVSGGRSQTMTSRPQLRAKQDSNRPNIQYVPSKEKKKTNYPYTQLYTHPFVCTTHSSTLPLPRTEWGRGRERF